MKLQRLHLRNFRCFADLVLEFDDRLTVIIGENGAGKTAILDAIAVGFGRFLTKLPGVAGLTSKETDLRVSKGERREPFLLLAWEISTFDGQSIGWASGRRRDAATTMLSVRRELSVPLNNLLLRGVREVDDYALRLVQAGADDVPYFLPVIAYYGTNRAVRQEVQRRRGFKKHFSRFDALVGALDSDSRFRAAFEWFNAMEDMERRERERRRDFDYRLPQLQVVRDAIERMLPSYRKPRTETRPLRFVIDKYLSDGSVQSLRISQLSDGYRVMLGLTMDLARRMAEANGHGLPASLEDKSPLDLPAIALIDEVDLHLHPRWQQRILNDLMQTFTQTQFIVTTHSPQVLSTVSSEQIRVIRATERGMAVGKPEFSPLGHESGDALALVMGTHREPDLPLQAQVRQFELLVRSGQEDSPEARELRKELEFLGYRFHDSDLATWRFLAARQQRKAS